MAPQEGEQAGESVSEPWGGARAYADRVTGTRAGP